MADVGNEDNSFVLQDRDDPKAIALAFNWLPACIAINNRLQEELCAELRTRFVGKELTPEIIEEMNQFLMNYLERKFPGVVGLRAVLEAARKVRFK